MAEKKKYNSILVSGRKDQTLTYSKYVKDEESGESVKESLDKKVNVTDELTTQQIKDGAITNEKMAADSVGNSNLQDGSVSNEKLEDGSITNEKLAENSITKDKLKDNTIGIEKLDPELRQTINAATGLPENLVETIQNIDDTLKDHQSQLDDKQSQIDDKQQQITANDEDISLLQTRSTQMEETIKSIAATGGASQATAVTYNNEKSKLTAVNIQSAVDEVVDKTAIKDEEGMVVETPFRYIQNEEYIFAKVDVNDKLLFGIQWDGTPVFGKTSTVEDRLQSQVALLAEKVATIMGDEDTTNVIDTMNELKKFFAEIENTQTLTSILANLDKTTIKDEKGNVQDTPFKVIENEEFIHAVIDSEGRLLFGIYRDSGKPYFPQNDMYHISQSEEFLWVILDAANHPLLGIQQDGTCWAVKAQWLDDIKAIKEALSSIDETLKTFQPKEDGKGLINLDVADSFFYISNDEYIIAVVDAENRILAAIKYDGEPYFPNHEMYSVITNEEWIYAIIDADNKVLCGFRADDGHMVVGGIDISTFISDAIIDISDIKERTAHLSTIINDEYLSIEIDADGKVIGYIAPDGSHYLYKVKSETIPEEFSHIEDPEGRTEIVTDAGDNVLAYRDSDGIRHENGMEVEQFYQKGNKIEYATKNYVDSKPIDDSEIVLSKLDGVVDYSLENLFDKNKIRTYDSDFATKVFNAIGRKTGATGCYSNNIPCKEGDWFTRNDFGTGIVVVLDKNDNILGDVRNVAYKPTFQIKASENQDFSKAVSVVMVVMLNALDTERIVNAKYVPSKEEDAIRIPKLKVGQENIELGITTYVKGSSGRYYSLNVEDLEGSPQINLVKLEGIPSSELPSDFPKFTISGSFSDYYKSLVLCPIEGGTEYLLELGTNGLVSRYLKKKVNCPRLIKENGVQYYYGVDGNLNSSNGELNIYKAKDETFELVKGNIRDSEGNKIEPHDCLVLSVNPLHIISQRYVGNQKTIVDGEERTVTSLHVEEQYDGKRVWLWKSEDYPELWKDSHYKGNNEDYLHNNTICIDKDNNLVLNNKQANQILVISRTWSDDTHIGTIGDILWKIGGNRGSNYNYDVETRIKTTTEQQWYECHDAIVNNEGLYTLFDNKSSGSSRIVEFNIDTENKAVKNFNSFTYQSYRGRYMGSVDILADGIFLVSWGSLRSAGTPNIGIYDFKNQKKIFELKFESDSYSAYRVYGIKNV